VLLALAMLACRAGRAMWRALRRDAGQPGDDGGSPLDRYGQILTKP
jgi:hypothetical protein